MNSLILPSHYLISNYIHKSTNHCFEIWNLAVRIDEQTLKLIFMVNHVTLLTECHSLQMISFNQSFLNQIHPRSRSFVWERKIHVKHFPIRFIFENEEVVITNRILDVTMAYHKDSDQNTREAHRIQHNERRMHKITFLGHSRNDHSRIDFPDNNCSMNFIESRIVKCKLKGKQDVQICPDITNKRQWSLWITKINGIGCDKSTS
jgi:hypothetical protein